MRDPFDISMNTALVCYEKSRRDIKYRVLLGLKKLSHVIVSRLPADTTLGSVMS